MKTAAQPAEVRRAEPDLIDRVAGALPAEVRADYYRELRHCRSLPEDDEMLRILRAMQFLVLLIHDAPGRVAVERELIEQSLNQIRDHLRETLDASQEYHVQLEQRLTALPDEIAKGISPDAIAGTIKENLRQQFIRSTLPETAEALNATSQQMRKVCGEFSATARSLGDAYRGAAQDASRAVGAMRSEISSAANAAESAIKELSLTFHKAYRWTAYSLSGLAVLMGFVLGMMAEFWIMSPPKPVAEAPPVVVQAAPQEAPTPKKKR
jgi:hypothetical protein